MKDIERLLAITEGCREDMHEPDEQGLTASCIGDRLDNAFGESIREDAILRGYQEFIVVLRRGGKTESFNLATLIALAKRSTG